MNYTVVINCSVWGGALLYYYIDARKWSVFLYAYVSGILTDEFRFTGPKITLSEDDLTDEQQEALKVEGLEVNIEPRGTDETQDAPISKDIERS
jgi:hypothetical protein